MKVHDLTVKLGADGGRKKLLVRRGEHILQSRWARVLNDPSVGQLDDHRFNLL
jgi:hypothetical protein